MTIRAISTILGLAAALGAGAALAQQQPAVARLTNMEGNVHVSQGDAMVAATNNQPVPAGVRVVTMSGAKVTVNYFVGCDVRLNENERFTVRSGECGALQREVVALGPAPGAIGGGVAPGAAGLSGGSAVATIAVSGVVGYGVYEIFKKSVSPN